MTASNGESADDLEKNIDLTDQGDTEDPDVVESDEEDVEEEDEDDIEEEGPEGLENEMKTIPTVEAPPEQTQAPSEFTQPPTPTQAQAPPVINEFGTAPPPRPQTPIPEQQPTLFDGAPDARIRRR